MPRATVTFSDGSTGTYNVPANATPEQLAAARRSALGTDYDRPDLINKPSYVVTRPEVSDQEVDPSTGRIISGLGVETSMSIGSQVLGAMTGPLYFPITFLGGAGGSITAQKIEGRGWDDIHWGRVVSAGVLTMVPGSSAARGAKGLARIAKPLATEAARGAGYGVTDATIRAYIDEGRAPTGKELLTYGTIGAGFTTALKGAGMAISKRFPRKAEAVSEALWEIPDQEITSKATSQPQVSSGIIKLKEAGVFNKGDVVLDLGGGKYDKGKDFLKDEAIDFEVIDFFNKSAEHNRRVIEKVKSGGADVTMSHNTLNVIPDYPNRLKHVQQLHNALKPGGKAYITTYSKKGTGVGEETTKGFQSNIPTKEYIPLVEQVFGQGNVTIKSIGKKSKKAVIYASKNVSEFSDPSEVVDNLQLVAGRLSNFKERPFVEKNELIKNLRLNSDDGEPLGLVADDLIAAGQVTKADVDEADRILGKFKNSLEGEAKDIAIMEGAFASANPMDPNSIKRKYKAADAVERLLGTNFPSRFIASRLRGKIQAAKQKIKSADELTTKFRKEVNRELIKNPESTIGSDSFKYLSGEIDVITPAMKRVEGHVLNLRDLNIGFQRTIFPFLDANFLKKIPEEQRKFLENFEKSIGKWTHRTHRLMDDPDYIPKKDAAPNLKKFLASKEGEGEGFYFEVETIRDEVSKRIKGYVMKHNKQPLPDWAKDSDGKPWSGKLLKEKRNEEINTHIDRYHHNSAANKAVNNLHDLRKSSLWMNETDILKFRRRGDWPEPYVKFFGGDIRIKGDESKIDYGGIIEIGTSQLARKAVNDELDFITANALISSGLVKSITPGKAVNKALFKEGAEEARINAAAQGIGSPTEGGRGVTKMQLFGGNLEVETAPEIAAALESIRFDTMVGDAADTGGQTILNNMLRAYQLAVFGTKLPLVGYNLASYSTNAVGAIGATLVSGNNPFKNVISGIRASTTELGSIKNKPELMKSIIDAQQRGILDNSVKAEAIYSTLKGHGGWHQKVLEMPFVKLPGTLYSAIDNTWRYVNFKGNSAFMDDLVPKNTTMSNHARNEMVMDMGATMTNQTYPTWDGVNPQLKKLSHYGVLPVFVTFNAEIIRTMTNSATMGWKMIRKPTDFLIEMGLSPQLISEVGEGQIKQIRNRGYRMLASLVAVSAGITGAAKGINDLRTGFTAEKRQAMEDFIPEWDKNKTLIYMPDEDDPSKGKYINLAYLNPYSIAPRIIGAASKAVVTGDYEKITNIFLEEFAGEGNFIVKNAMTTLSGRDERGEFISGSVEEGQQMRDKWEFFITESFKPVLYDDVVNILQIAGVKEGTPRRTGPEMMSRFLGVRPQDYDVNRSLMYKSNELGLLMNQNRRALTSLIRPNEDKQPMSDSLLREGRRSESARELSESNQQFNQTYNEVNRNYRGIMDHLVGMTESAKMINNHFDDQNKEQYEEEIVKIFKSSRLNSSDILDILNGDVDNFKLVQSPSTSDLWSLLEESLGGEASIQQVLTKAKEIHRGDPQTLQSLYSYGRTLNSNRFRKLDTEDKLLVGLSGPQLFDQLYKIYPNIRGNIPLKKELARAGILSQKEFYFIDQYVPQTGNRSQKVNPFNQN